jgi:hypothetical protein
VELKRLAELKRLVGWRSLVRWLPAPFLLIGSAILTSHAQSGFDAHIYYQGAVAWLHGDDPWNVAFSGLHFAAPPWVLPIIAPSTLLNEPRAVGVWIALDAVAAAYIVRRSGLAWGWILFPPLVHGTLNGNPAIASLALLLAGAGPIGVLVRPQVGYALVGERRWRAATISAVVGIALLAIIPWQAFLADLSTITARYVTESHGGSTGGTLIAFAVGIMSVLALATVDLREAGWLATIVAVPINGWYAGAAALPVMNPMLAVGLSLPVVGLPTAAIAAYAAVRVVIRWAPPGGPARFLAPLVERYRPDDVPDRPAWPFNRPAPVQAEARSPVLPGTPSPVEAPSRAGQNRISRPR